MTVTIKDTDMGMAAMLRRFETLDGATVEAGLFDPVNATKGMRAEKGTRDMPGRPWLSVAADTGVPQIVAASAESIRDVADGEAPDLALDGVGKAMAKLARDVIVDQKVGGPALADSTIDRKGYGRKLEDSGEMLDAIGHEVDV